MLDENAVLEMVAELRRAGTDSYRIEAKRSRTALPNSCWESMSAFANSSGGTLLLGVDERGGEFNITGVEDPSKVASDLQSECAELEPPLRPIISTVHLEEASVIVAQIEPLPLSQRPCHRRSLGAHNSSFVRVGDADQKLRSVEIDAMIAARSGHDHSLRPAPADASLDPTEAARFCRQLRIDSTRRDDTTDEQLLEAFGATVRHRPTIAGLLTLGVNPETHCQAARVTVRRLPTPSDPPGTRHEGDHVEGTVGELLDGTLDWIRARLTNVQVSRDGALIDDTDVPLEALREIVSNALVHRSFSEADSTILVEVSESAVVITSPGGLHVDNDPCLLGIGARNGLRNTSLVRICEKLDSPSGARIVEGQNLGIAQADLACRRAGSMPPLFADQPTQFQVTLIRRSIDPAPAVALAADVGVELTADQERVLSVIHRLGSLGDETVLTPWATVPVDARFCARALSGSSVEDAAVVLHDLEDFGLLARSGGRTTPTWRIPVRSEQSGGAIGRRGRTNRVPDLLAAIASSSSGDLRAKAIGEALGLASPSSRNRWIRAAESAGLIESTKESLFDPNAAYRLTAKGFAQHSRDSN